MTAKVSIIIPVYNEEKTIVKCLNSLQKQAHKNKEIIVINDGSFDSTEKLVKKFDVIFLKQKHLGPGTARNLGASKSTGKILVFVDADMTFDKKFIGELVKPIIEGTTIGTFSKNEFVANSNNIWSKCWNINKGLNTQRMIPANYPNTAPVYRAILKSEFDKVNGFDTTGEYTDDWSLSKKLGIKSQVVAGATYYHSNPDSLKEVWSQARWIGKNAFISGSLKARVKSLLFYSLPTSTIVGITKSAISRTPEYFVFKLIYNSAVFTSVFLSFVGEKKYK